MKRSILILGHDYNFWWRTQLKGGDELDLCQSPFESFFKEFMNLLFRSLKSGSNFSFRKVLSSPISYCLFPFEWLFVSKSSFWIQLSINNCWQINQIKIAIIVKFYLHGSKLFAIIGKFGCNLRGLLPKYETFMSFSSPWFLKILL